MKRVALLPSIGPPAAASFLLFTTAISAGAFEREPAAAGHALTGTSADCVLMEYNTCSCWIWVYTDTPGAVWGAVYSPRDCVGGCADGGELSDMWLYGHCAEYPSTSGGLAIYTVDAAGCLVSELFDTGPFTTTHCLPGDRWTHIDVPLVHLDGQSLAVTFTWGQDGPSAQPASDCGIANLMCSLGVSGTFPGCPGTACDCEGWTLPVQHSYIYVTDVTGDTVPDDLCALYGYPYPLAFPYYAPYGYLPNNLIIALAMDCTVPENASATSWGRVKALYE